MVAGADRMAADSEHQRLPLSPVPMIQREDDRPRPCLHLLGMVLRCSILAAVVAAAVDAVYRREKLYRRSTYAFAFDDPDTRKYARYLARDSGSAPSNFSAAAWAAAYGAAASAVRRCDTQEMTTLYVGRKASACGNGANRACKRGFGLSAAGAFAACDGGHFCAEDAVCAVACPTGAACPPSVAQDGACAFPSELEKTTSPTNGLCPGSSAVHPCPSGFSCPDATTRLPCPAHHFCPKGSARPKRCSAFARCASERAARQDFSGASQRLALASLVLVVAIVRVSRLLQSFLAFLRRHRSRKRRAFRAAPVADAASDDGDDDDDAWGVIEVDGTADLDAYDALVDPVDSMDVALEAEVFGDDATAWEELPLAVPADARFVHGVVSRGAAPRPRPPPEDLAPAFRPREADERVDLTFRNLGLRLASGARVLGGVAGAARSAELTAVLGPSGAGKSTFLALLAGRRLGSGWRTGSVRVNGRRGGVERWCADRSAFVHQADALKARLTVWEALYFSSCLRLPAAHRRRRDLVEDVLEALDLARQKHALLGDGFAARGVSGGQRRRVSVGVGRVAGSRGPSHVDHVNCTFVKLPYKQHTWSRAHSFAHSDASTSQRISCGRWTCSP